MNLEAFFLDTGALTTAFAEVEQFGTAHLAHFVQLNRLDIGREEGEETLNTYTIRNFPNGESGGGAIALELDHVAAEALDTFFSALYNFVVDSYIIACFERRQFFFGGQLVVYKLNCCVHNFIFNGRQR